MTGGPGLYVYAIVPDRALPVVGAGIDGEPLVTVTAGGLAAVAHVHPGEPYAGDDATIRRRVLEHHEVIEGLWERERAVLPMTFDVVVAGTQERTAAARLEEWLRSAERSMAARLAVLAGHVELRVDLTLDVQEATDADPDVRALRTRMRSESPGLQRLSQKRLSRLQHDLAERAAELVHAETRPRLARWSSEIVENRLAAVDPGQARVLSVSLLVAEDLTSRIGEELTAITESRPAVRVRFLGPWPPYSFAELPELSAEQPVSPT